MTYSSKRQDQLMAKINKVLDRKKLVEPKPKKEKDEGYASHAQRKAVWANKADGGKGHPDNKKEDTAMTTTANIPNPIDTAMGPKKKKKLKVFKRWVENEEIKEGGL